MSSDPKFLITTYPEKCLTEVVFEGFLDQEEIREFGQAYHAAKASLPKGPEHHITIIDVTEFKIQSQPIADGFAAMLSNPAIRSNKLAFVLGDSPVRMQLRRMIGDNAKLFDDMDSARAWLSE